MKIHKICNWRTDIDEAVERAKSYLSGALAAMLDLGKGSGPMNHAFDIRSSYGEGPER